MSEYVMVQRNDRYWLVGPFASQADAAAWGRATYSLDDDPRWQTINLADAGAAPLVVAPASAEPEMA
jgi:hypothetical protein